MGDCPCNGDIENPCSLCVLRFLRTKNITETEDIINKNMVKCQSNNNNTSYYMYAIGHSYNRITRESSNLNVQSRGINAKTTHNPCGLGFNRK